VVEHFAKRPCALAPSGAQEGSPGREPWVDGPSPRLRRPSPAEAGEGTGGEGGRANPRLTPWATF